MAPHLTAIMDSGISPALTEGAKDTLAVLEPLIDRFEEEGMGGGASIHGYHRPSPSPGLCLLLPLLLPAPSFPSLGCD